MISLHVCLLNVLYTSQKQQSLIETTLTTHIITCIEFSSKMHTIKIPKISPGAHIFQRPFLRGLFLEGRFNGGFFVLLDWGAYIWRAYTWRGLFLEFYSTSVLPIAPFLHKGTTFHKRPINLCILGGP